MQILTSSFKISIIVQWVVLKKKKMARKIIILSYSLARSYNLPNSLAKQIFDGSVKWINIGLSSAKVWISAHSDYGRLKLALEISVLTFLLFHVVNY